MTVSDEHNGDASDASGQLEDLLNAAIAAFAVSSRRTSNESGAAGPDSARTNSHERS